MLLLKLNIEHINYVNTIANWWNSETSKHVILKIRVYIDGHVTYLLYTPDVRGEEIETIGNALTAFNLAATKINADHGVISE